MKYLHVLWQDDINFNIPLVEMLNNRELGFLGKEHIFITPHERVYNYLKNKNCNIIHTNRRGAEILNLYGVNVQWIFIHALNANGFEVVKIKNEIAKKIIWRTWGHDIFKAPNYLNSTKISLIFKWILTFLGYPLYVMKIHQFYGVGLGFKYDEILIKKYYGKMNCFLLPYVNYKQTAEYLDQICSESKNRKEPIKRIMIGHSGNPKLNHLQNLARLKKFCDADITICLVLSYGKKDYIKQVKEKAKFMIPENKLEIIEEYMEIEEYINYLNSMDVAVMDFDGSVALGNTLILLYLGKPIYIKRGSLMDVAFTNERLDLRYADDIERCSFDELFSPQRESARAKEFSKEAIGAESCVKKWHELLQKLNERSKQ